MSETQTKTKAEERAAAKANTLSASERKTLERRVIDKFKLVKNSISSEQIKHEQIKQALLEEKGILVSASELQAQHRDLQRQRDELIEPYLQDQKNDLRVQLAELNNEKQEEFEAAQKAYSDAISAAKLNLQRAREELDARYAATEQELKVNLEGVRERTIREHAAEITSHLSHLKREEMKAAEIERIVEQEARTRAGFLQRQASRIAQIIDDSQNRLLEDLFFVTTREDAKDLLEKVPTATYIFEKLGNGAQGYSELIQELNPSAAAALQKAPLLLGSEKKSDENIRDAEATEATIVNEDEGSDPYQTVQVGDIRDESDY